MLKIGKTLLNPNNICSIDRYEQITKNPYEPGVMKDYFRLSIQFLSVSKTIIFDTLKDLDDAFLILENYETNRFPRT